MSFLTGFKQMKADALRTNAQLPDGYGVGRSPPGQRLQNLARQEHDAQEAAARASAYSYNQYGSNRAPSYRGPAPPKAMEAMMSGMNKELRFEDPQAKALLQEIFQIPAFTEQLFSFPVHSRYQRRTFYGQPGMFLPGRSKAMLDAAAHGGQNRYSDVFDLPPSNEPERIGFRIYQAIDLYKDAWCFNSEHQSVPVLAGAETECKARVDEWVELKKGLLKAQTRTLPEEAQQAVYQAPVAPPVQAPPMQAPPPPVMMPAVEESPAKPLSYPPPLGSQLYPPTSSATSTYRTGAGVAGASTGAGPSSAALEAEAEANAAAAAAAAKAEHERLAAANQSTAKLHAARAEAHRLAAAAISV